MNFWEIVGACIVADTLMAIGIMFFAWLFKGIVNGWR